MQLQSLDDVLQHQLNDLMSAEQQLVAALPKMAQAASHDELRSAFDNHLQETRGHVNRLEEVFSQVGATPSGEPCKAMQGLIAEGEEVIATAGDPSAKDAALIAAAQRVEHYEIAAYGTAKALAGELDQGDAENLLDQTLTEEGKADKLLTKIATGGLLREGINRQAQVR
jgi:ferritin-like metal-binding protein YciE